MHIHIYLYIIMSVHNNVEAHMMSEQYKTNSVDLYSANEVPAVCCSAGETGRSIAVHLYLCTGLETRQLSFVQNLALGTVPISTAQ